MKTSNPPTLRLLIAVPLCASLIALAITCSLQRRTEANWRECEACVRAAESLAPYLKSVRAYDAAKVRLLKSEPLAKVPELPLGLPPAGRATERGTAKDGFVSVGDKLLSVYVWGTDAENLAAGEVVVNEPLRQKLGNQEDMVLHLPPHNLVPSGSLFVTKSYATQMRVHVAGVKRVEEGGNLLLKNEQTLPLNVFIDRRQLAEKMELEGKINLVLSDDIIEEKRLVACWTPEQSGIHLTDSRTFFFTLRPSRSISA